MDVNKRETLGKLFGAGLVLGGATSLIAQNAPSSYIYEGDDVSAADLDAPAGRENEVITNNVLPGKQDGGYDFWNMPRKLYLKRFQESARIIYFNDGRINQEGYQLACYLLRDVEQNRMTNMDLRLLDLLCAMQAWLIHFGYEGPIIINSGYRNAVTNRKYRGARSSMHLMGKACDFKIPGMSSANLAKIAAQFKAGGIGIYQSRGYVHLDTGGIRSWVVR